MRLPPVGVRQAKRPDDAWDVGDPCTPLPVFGHRFRYRFRSIELDWLGHEGSVVAHGHVRLMPFAAACDSLARRDGATLPTRDWMAFTRDVSHRYAVHALGSSPENWRIHWSDVYSDTPGAFPVTIYGTGM